MNTLELFCGTKSFSHYAKSKGLETFTVDVEEKFNPSLQYDLLKPFPEILKKKIREANIIWMSPPCQTFSMAAGNTHWTADRKPKTNNAIIGRNLLLLCLRIARYCDTFDKIYFIENPRARARWFLPVNTRKTVWYCRYGDDRAKPTDIWTNLKGWKGKQCANGNRKCHHQPAPRGSKTGTQGRKGAKERGEIPELLFKEIFEVLNVFR